MRCSQWSAIWPNRVVPVGVLTSPGIGCDPVGQAETATRSAVPLVLCRLRLATNDLRLHRSDMRAKA
jgi:hypothetical protein